MLALLVPGVGMGGSPSHKALVFTFTVQATDANGVSGTLEYTLTVIGLSRYLFSIRATDAGGYLGQQAYEMLVRAP